MGTYARMMGSVVAAFNAVKAAVRLGWYSQRKAMMLNATYHVNIPL